MPPYCTEDDKPARTHELKLKRLKSQPNNKRLLETGAEVQSHKSKRRHLNANEADREYSQFTNSSSMVQPIPEPKQTCQRRLMQSKNPHFFKYNQKPTNYF
uniref:Uncharacterized protein n=1 Tax=Spongospora subterranea TaxID=70186 RepID=A0A0H5R040_9EUKA|eukprot:CRZ07502.1 hypothetical protein [Spongospora subterranea]